MFPIQPNQTNCRHMFCEYCIVEWMKRNDLCPTCQSPLDAHSYMIGVNNHITNQYEFIGGAIKEARVALLKQRSDLSNNK